jgi:hypothetical protein
MAILVDNPVVPADREIKCFDGRSPNFLVMMFIARIMDEHD